LYTKRVTESDCLFLADRDSGSVPTVPIGVDLFAQDTQPENKESPQSSVDEHEDRPHSHEPMPQGVSWSDPSPSQGSGPRKKRRRDPKPESAMQLSPRLLRRSKRKRVPRRFLQIKEDIFFCMPLEIEEPTSYVEVIDSPNHKE